MKEYNVTFVDTLNGAEICRIIRAYNHDHAYEIAQNYKGMFDCVETIVEIEKMDERWRSLTVTPKVAEKIKRILREGGLYFEPSDCYEYIHFEIRIRNTYEGEFADAVYNLAKAMEMRGNLK